jgi:tripartite-type tricarboxylate transporter receptor subunit TctC
MEANSKRKLVIDYRPGGGGVLAYGAVARSAPDGTTITMGQPAPVFSLYIKDPGFNAADVVPVSLMASLPYMLLASKDSNFRNIADVVAAAKANPGKIAIGILPATGHEAETVAMMKALGITGNLVGYKGLAPILTALAANEIQLTMGAGSPLVKAGRLVGIAAGGSKRSSDYPDVPTFKESGIDYDPQTLFYVLGRAGTPRDIQDKLAEDVIDAARSKDFSDKITALFTIQGVGTTQPEAVRIARDDFEKLKKTAEQAGIKPQ